MGTKVGIGAGFIVTALAGFGVLQNLPASLILLGIGLFLILHGGYEIIFKPRMFLQKRITKWLLARNWVIGESEENPQFCFIIQVEDNAHRKVTITRGKKEAKNILVFTAPIHKGKEWEPKLARLTTGQRGQLIEDIHVFFASNDMAYDGAEWPLDKLAVQHALELSPQLSEHLVDLKAKEVINAVIGVRSLIRKAIISLESDKEDSQTE